jgi:hypothetical protein
MPDNGSPNPALSAMYPHKPKDAPFRWLGYKEARNTQTGAFYVANMLFNGAL